MWFFTIAHNSFGVDPQARIESWATQFPCSLSSYHPPILSITALAFENSAFLWPKSNSSSTKDIQNCFATYSRVSVALALNSASGQLLRVFSPIKKGFLFFSFHCIDCRNSAHLSSDYRHQKQVPEHLPCYCYRKPELRRRKPPSGIRLRQRPRGKCPRQRRHLCHYSEKTDKNRLMAHENPHCRGLDDHLHSRLADQVLHPDTTLFMSLSIDTPTLACFFSIIALCGSRKTDLGVSPFPKGVVTTVSIALLTALS